MINLQKTFGKQFATNEAREDLPKAQVWANIGYSVETGDAENPTVFVSLPLGIPVDTMEELAIRGNGPFAQLTASRNDLLAQVQAAAAELAPGASILIGDPEGICIQLRRVNDPVAAPAVDDSNPFARKVL